MTHLRIAVIAGLTAALAVTSGCANRGAARAPVETPPADELLDDIVYQDKPRPTSTLWDLFKTREDSGKVGAVNKYIWFAALDVLDFLPVQSVDPFTGVVTTGYGTPPGGGRAYRATVHISDPALDARSLNLALMTRSGPASPATTRAVEDAILTRARQLRAQDSKL